MMRAKQTAPVRVVEAKRWYRSKTVWLNGVASALLLFQAVAENVFLLQPMLPQRWWPLTLAVITIANVWLRLTSRGPIAPRREWRDAPSNRQLPAGPHQQRRPMVGDESWSD